MFMTLCAGIPRDPDFPARTHRLDILGRVLNGTIYDALNYAFHDERGAGGEYIPLRLRRPSVRYGLARIVVDDSVSLLFSEGHFPDIECADGEIRAAVAALARSTGLNSIMTEAALRGSVGSVAIHFRILQGRPFLEVMDALYMTPEWNALAPDALTSVTERRKVTGADLLAQGYSVPDQETDYWFARRWDAEWETWYVPTPTAGAWVPVVDAVRSVRHGLGFVPVVWIKNLPGGEGFDGSCSFRAAIENSIEIDYQLSQAGRGLKYSSDPTLLIREPAGIDGTMVRGAANALVVSEHGDAKLLEIGGTASQAVIDYVRMLRELALESVHGNRVDASRLTAPASGRALELMNQGLLWLADNLRVSYGEGAILPLMRMMLRASRIYTLRLDTMQLRAVREPAPLTLRWPDWYPADSADRQRDAQTVTGLVAAGQMSRETALRVLAPEYGIVDLTAELSRIGAESTG
jgi:hypothetical protein